MALCIWVNKSKSDVPRGGGGEEKSVSFTVAVSFKGRDHLKGGILSGMPLSGLHRPHCQGFYGERSAGTFLTLHRRGAGVWVGVRQRAGEAKEN